MYIEKRAKTFLLLNKPMGASVTVGVLSCSVIA